MRLTSVHNCIVLDASCVISLYASGQMTSILESISETVVVSQFVFEKEALRIYGGPEGDERSARESIRLQPLVDAGLLRVETIQLEAEMATFVNFAVEVDDGEAITGALALHRHWAIGVDDKKARALFSREAAGQQLFYTLELVKHWVEATTPSPAVISSVLRNIQRRATYIPAKTHPLYSWWEQHGGG